MPKDKDTISTNGNGYDSRSTTYNDDRGEWETDPQDTYSGFKKEIRYIGDKDDDDDDKGHDDKGDAGKCDAGKKGSSCVILGGRITKRKRSKYRLNKRKSRLKRKKQVSILRR